MITFMLIKLHLYVNGGMQKTAWHWLPGQGSLGKPL